MPVHPRGRGCFQWGTHGKVYCGPGARGKAERQGRAAHARGYRSREESASKLTDTQLDVLRLIAEGRHLGDYVPGTVPALDAAAGRFP